MKYTGNWDLFAIKSAVKGMKYHLKVKSIPKLIRFANDIDKTPLKFPFLLKYYCYNKNCLFL